MFDLSNFSKFDGKTVRSSDPYLTILKTGSLTLSSGLVREIGKAFKEFVHLYYSESDNAMAILFPADEKGVVKITNFDDVGKTRSLAIRSFCSNFNLSIEDIAGQYEPEVSQMNEGTYVVIALKMKK